MNKIMSATKVVRDIQIRMSKLKESGISYKVIRERAGVKERWFSNLRHSKDPNVETKLLDKVERAILFYEEKGANHGE